MDFSDLIDAGLKVGGVTGATIALWAMVNRTWRQASDIYRESAEYAKQDTQETRALVDELQTKLAQQQKTIDGLLDERMKVLTAHAEDKAARAALESRVSYLEEQLSRALEALASKSDNSGGTAGGSEKQS